MKVCVLASGSSGNSTFIESKGSSVLVDAGISSREIINRLSNIGKDIEDIDGIFVTHEHTDHIKGVERLNRNHKIPIHLNRQTYENSPLSLNKPAFFEEGQTVLINDLNILPVPLNHDAAMPCGFHIREDEKSVAVFTDFGKASEEQKKITRIADGLVLETNHDIDMLINGPYPYNLKQRILGDNGHFSNIDAGLLVKEYGTEALKKVFLAHISKNNNTSELAMDTFSKITAQNKKLKLTSILTKQEANTELFSI